MTEEELRCMVFNTEQTLGVADLQCVLVGRVPAGIKAENK